MEIYAGLIGIGAAALGDELNGSAMLAGAQAHIVALNVAHGLLRRFRQ